MITVRNLRKLLDVLPDGTKVIAHGSGRAGLKLEYDGVIGWIETGFDDDEKCEVIQHEILKITQKANRNCYDILYLICLYPAL